MDEYFIEEKSKGDMFLDFLVFIAVFVVTVFLILEIVAQTGKTGLDIVSVNNVYFYINFAVFLVFFVDLVRLWNHSQGLKDFFRHNWLDVLATIPFGLIAWALSGVPTTNPSFEVLKLLRVARLTGLSRIQKISRISKISKEFKAASHLKKEGSEYKRKHRL